MRRTGGERMVIIPRQNLGVVTERSIERQQSVCAKIRIRGPWAMIAVFAHGSPSGEKRPHRSVMVARRIVEFRMGRDDPHAPVRFLIGVRESGDHFFSLSGVGQFEPHGYGGKHTGFVHTSIVFIQREGIHLFFGRPKRLIERRLPALELRGQSFLIVSSAEYTRQMRKRAQRLSSECALVVLRRHGKQRASFHPAMSNAVVPWEPRDRKRTR